MPENISNRGKQHPTGIQNFGWRAAAPGLMPLAAARPCAEAEGPLPRAAVHHRYQTAILQTYTVGLLSNISVSFPKRPISGKRVQKGDKESDVDPLNYNRTRIGNFIKTGGKSRCSNVGTSENVGPRNGSPTPVARGGIGAKVAPPLRAQILTATRPLADTPQSLVCTHICSTHRSSHLVDDFSLLFSWPCGSRSSLLQKTGDIQRVGSLKFMRDALERPLSHTPCTIVAL